MLFSVISLSSCSGVSNTKPLFVYGIGIDASEMGFAVHFLCGKAEEKKQDSSEKGTENKEQSQDNNSEKMQKPFEIYTFSGTDFEQIFDAFFNSFEDVYTASNKIYALSENLTQEQIYAFKIFLTNSNKLPVKKETVTMPAPLNYLESNAESLME